MKGSKDNMKTLKKLRRSRISESDQEQKKPINLPQRVFLYLHPKSISYPTDENMDVEIEIEHRYNTITTISDHFMTRNIIKVEQFEIEKPTFSITIEQDSLEDITNLSDNPIMLTLYVQTRRSSNTSQLTEEEESEENMEDNRQRIAVAQGFIDIMEYFNKKRSHGTDTIYLYPLKTYPETVTYKTIWEIYSLHPLLKHVAFTNVLFINFGSLYNINEELMQDCDDLVTQISFISKIPNENKEYDKIFICKFTTFYKNTISSQNLSKKWESLKNKEIENSNSMGITSESKFHLHHLFTNILGTENAQFNLENINITEDFALICNSLHRYMLTDVMQKTLEEILSQNQYQVVVELYKEREENTILLQGYIDLSVFMYPEVRFCSFAIELRPPNSRDSNRDTVKTAKGKQRKSQAKSNSQVEEDKKIPFAIIQICLNTPITNSLEEMNQPSDHKSKRHKYSHCTTTILTKTTQKDLATKCEENYRDFDDLIREILDYMILNNIKTLNDDKEYFCHQLGNLTNKIMKLIACDFNIKTHTETNIEFTNLLTIVYRELISRINAYLNRCGLNDLADCVLTMTAIENSMLKNMSAAKYLYEVGGNTKMADFIMNNLRSEYANNFILDFYIFLYDIERQNFALVKEYLNRPLDERDNQAESFEELIQIYINYKLQLQDPEKSSTAEEFLIKALTDHNMNHKPKSLTGWILLHCLYKKYNYQPGMAYCRWKYENLYSRSFVKLEFIPKSRWEIYMPYKIQLKSLKGQNYIKVFVVLLRLGLYAFAEWVFAEISEECLEIERYFVASTFRVLNNKELEKNWIKTFAVDKLTNSQQMIAVLSLVNGNLEYLREANGPAAIKQYQKLTEIEDLKDLKLYQLGLWRYAHKMMEEQSYEDANQVFLNFCKENVNSMVAAVERGKTCLYLSQLEEAEKYFALSTQHGMYMPNTWAYLALINLKRGNNYNALECWKYAKLNENSEISKEILNELNKINISDICLYVDVPNKT